MSQKFFTENKKKILLGVFGVVFFAAIFWLVQPAQKAEAVCINPSMGCKSDNGCYFDVGDGVIASHEVCINGNVAEKDYWTWSASCTSGINKCQQDICAGGANGSACSVLANAGGSSCDTPGNYFTSAGKWETSSSSCIQCSGAYKAEILASPTIRNPPTIISSDSRVFSTACGASAACQGYVQGNQGGCPGGQTCNVSGQCTGGDCTGNAPGISISPATYSGPTGAKTFTLNIKNNDSSACNSASVPLKLTALSGGTSDWGPVGSIASTTAIVPNGGTGTWTIDITISGNGGFTVQAASPNDSTKINSASATYTLAALSVSTNPTSVTTGTPTNITVMVKNAGNNVVPNASINLSGGASGSCTTGGGGFCTINSVRATGNITVTADDGTGNTGSATITATSPACVAGVCGGIGGAQWCPVNGGPWQNCLSPGNTCIGGVCASSSFPNCNQPSCGGTVINATCLCGLQKVTANGGYCCAAENYYGSLGTCQTKSACVSAPPPLSCNNNDVQDNGETGVDCGGGGCPACPVIPSTPPGPCASGRDNYRSPLSYCSIQDLIQAATGWVLGLVSSIVILFLVYGGIMYTMAAGDETKMESAKNIIYYAILGLAIILVSYTLITEVKTILKVK